MARAEESISKIVQCLQYVRPALEADRVTLIYDDSIERRGLINNGAGIMSEVNRLTNRDIRTQWFLYTRNHAVRSEAELCTVTVSADGVEQVLIGDIRRQLFDAAVSWLSFGG